MTCLCPQPVLGTVGDRGIMHEAVIGMAYACIAYTIINGQIRREI